MFSLVTCFILLLMYVAGTSAAASGNFKSMLDSAAKRIIPSPTRFLLRHLPFPRLMALASSNNIGPVSMLLIHVFGATSHSFLNSASLSYKRSSDPGTIAVAAADHVLRIRPLPCSRTSHLIAVLNQKSDQEGRSLKG
jgi:hypothetical protein